MAQSVLTGVIRSCSTLVNTEDHLRVTAGWGQVSIPALVAFLTISLPACGPEIERFERKLQTDFLFTRKTKAKTFGFGL